MKTAVAYLDWHKFGFEPIQRFIRSYEAHDAGGEHELVVIGNGRRFPVGIPDYARFLPIERGVSDIEAYRILCESIPFDRYLFLNSHTEILCDDWLKLMTHWLWPSVGVVAATASMESMYTNKPAWWRRIFFPPFPNPHIRTTGFLIRREVMQAVWHKKSILCKRHAFLFESGRNSLTRRIRSLGMRVIVASRTGATQFTETWRDTNTYRWGNQSGLIFADNQTRIWEAAAPPVQKKLSRLAWGTNE